MECRLLQRNRCFLNSLDGTESTRPFTFAQSQTQREKFDMRDAANLVESILTAFGYLLSNEERPRKPTHLSYW